MPIKLKKTVSTSAVTGNSVQFNGTSQYLSIGNNAAFNLSTNNFTAEAWVYLTNSNAQQTIVGQWSGLVGGTTLSWIILTSNDANRYARFLISNNGSGVIGDYISANAIPLNTWSHLALVRNGSAFNLYLNGISVTSTSTSVSVYYATNAITIGATSSPGQFLGGYISNARIINGTALYTSSFTAPTTPLTAIANTSLLTCNAATIVDASSNNFTITNNNTATVSSAVVPFTTSRSVFKLKKNNANPVAPYSVLFNGSNQYLSVANNAAFSFGTGNYTVEGWMYFNVLDNYRPLFSNGAATAGAVGLYTNPSKKLQYDEYYGGSFIGTTVLSISTWYHVAVTRSGSTIRLFLNGNIENSNTTTFNNNTDGLIIGGAWIQSSPHNTLNGYISNFRIVKGTALYTASFSVPTAPLTAIANTSLLTCNADTIVDASSNNFTITNNNTATVSSTITPFTASISTNKFKLRQVSYSSAVSGTQKAIFGYGDNGISTSYVSMTNLVSNTGVVATDTAGVGTARVDTAAAGYGTDKAIFGYGNTSSGRIAITNLVSNTGVVSTDTTGVGTARNGIAAAGYGTDKAIFGYGTTGANTSITNLVSSTGVVATDTTGVGTARAVLAAAGYGTDKAIFGYGTTGAVTAITNKVSNTGVVATDTTGVGTARLVLAASGYGSDKAIFGYGYNNSVQVSMTNLVSNTGVVATDVTGVGTARFGLSAAGYGSDKAIFGYGYNGTSYVSMTNLVSNTGVVATDTAGVGTARNGLAAAGYSLS